MKNPFLERLFAAKLLLLVACIALLSWAFLPARTTLLIVAEKGPIENTTVFLWYLAIAVLWLFRSPTMEKRATLGVTVVMVAMAARELDLHKALTGTSMLKSRFWLGMTPLPQELEALVLLAPVIAAVLFLGVRYWRWFRDGLARRRTVACTVFTFFAAMVISKCADRSLGILKEVFGYRAPDWLVAMFQSIEEPFEMVLPVLISIAVVQGLLLASAQNANRGIGNRAGEGDASLTRNRV